MKAVFGVVPSQTTLETMVRTAFVAFANAMSSRSMAPFFATTAKAFQESVTVREAEATFFQSEFGRSKLVPLDWTAAARATYQFAKPAAIDGDGVLAVNARVAFGASRVKFSLKYLIEGPEWRLASFHVEPVAESR